MNEVEEKKTWTEVLPSLFELLVENADGIIDDTSLQRILEWLKDVCKNEQELQKLLQCGTLEFMSKDQVFSNPESSAFFLRLFGFLAARAEVFHSFKCGGKGDFVARFLDKPRNDPNLWNEGIVRDGYFQALISLTEHKDGILWLRSSDHIECALDCVSDRSMYVANSARSLITKFLVKESDWMVNQTLDTVHSFTDNDKVVIIVERLRSMLNPEASTTTTSMMAVIEVTRMLLCESSVSGQKVLQDTKLFPECLNLMKVGDATVCQKLVDVICEIVKNSTGSLEWGKLTATENNPWVSGSEILLGNCVDLFKKGLISTGLELVAGLGSCQEHSRDFPLHWLEVLFGVTELTLDVILNQATDDNGESQNGYHVNGSEDLDTGLIKGLLSREDQGKSFSKQKLQLMLSPWSKESHSLTQVICQAIATAQQLTQQASSQHHSHVLYWLKICVDLLHYCINPAKRSTLKLHGNQKVLKVCLEFIASFAEVQRSKDIFESTEYSALDQLFNDLVRTLLQLIESSESTATVISTALKTLGKILDAARPEFLTKLFSSEIRSADETSTKQAKLENSPPCEDIDQSSNIKAENREKLAFMLYRRLRDSRWEVRDSTLEFVASLLQLLNQDSVQEFLCFHNIPVLVWKAVDDGESYVRASAIHLISSLACQSQLWTSLLQTCQISEENILEKLSSVLLDDDEAFSRRRAMECLTVWVANRHPMISRILRCNKAVQTERFPTSDEVQVLEVGRKSEVTKIPSGYEIARTVHHACRDFDWEVKLRGLEFWEAVIDCFTGFKTNNRSAGISKAKTGSLSGEELVSDARNEESLQAGGVEKCLEVLFDMGALNVLSEALNDCDHMVCEKALEVLASLQQVAFLKNSTLEQCVKTSRDFQEKLGKEFGLEKFKKVLQATDLPALVQSCEAADNALRSDPVSLIEDILLAAEHHEENLLDCY